MLHVLVVISFLEKPLYTKYITPQPRTIKYQEKIIFRTCSESNWHHLEQRVRRAVQDVVHCDARTDPIIEGQIMPFDAIIITLCLEEACTTFEGLKNTVKKLAAMLKPKGHFIIFIVLEETFYKVGDQIIEVTPFTEEQVLEAITESGLNIKERYNYTRHSHESEGEVVDDYSTMLCILAQKCQ